MSHEPEGEIEEPHAQSQVTTHEPVLSAEAAEYLLAQKSGLVVDCTLGLGGHAEVLLRHSEVELIGIDRDPEAIRIATERLAPFGSRFRAICGDFADLDEILAANAALPVSAVLADLGVSSLQLSSPERGFSFQRDGPLDMRMGPQEGNASDVVNSYSEVKLQRIFRDYGEERHARRIAAVIVARRRSGEITTTRQLRQIVVEAKGRLARSDRRRIDPATKVFQALRIEVNRELVSLEKLLEQGIRRLDSDGRIVIISYHSLEDRIVKNVFRHGAKGDVDPVTGQSVSESQVLEVLTRRPIRPSDREVASNPRSRSARLRAARRL